MVNRSNTARLCFMCLCSIVTCALTMKYYVEENVSQRSCTTIRHVIKMLGSISETLIFFFLGMVTITTEHEWNWGYILFTLLFAFVWRGLGESLGFVLASAAANT